MKSRRLYIAGFSLLEAMVCIGIMSIVLFGGTSAMVTALQQTTDDKQRWNAAEIGSMWMETLVNSYITNGLLNQGTQDVYFNEDYTQGTAANYFYDVKWNVNQNSPVIGVYDIQLWVYWSESGSQRFVAFETYR